MIVDVLIMILLTSVWVFAIKISTYEDMVFERLGKWADAKVESGKKIYEALLTCEWCMPSVHSVFIVLPIAIFVGVIDFQYKFLALMPFVIGGASFVSGMLWNLTLVIIKNLSILDKTEQLKHFDVKDRKEKYFKQKSHQNGIHT